MPLPFGAVFRRVPDSQTEVSMEVWYYWALFCGSPGIICTWGKKKKNNNNNIIIIIIIISTFCRLVTRAAVVQLRPLSQQRSHPNRGCTAPWCHYVSPAWLPMWTNNWRSRTTLLLVLEKFRQAYAAQHFERHCVADNDQSEDTVYQGTPVSW